MKVNWERLAFGLPLMAACLVLIAADAQGYINLGKFGYAGIATWITLMTNFYFRKSPKP